MCRFMIAFPIVLAAITVLRADSFDNYANPLLIKAVQAKEVIGVKKLTPEMMVEHSRVLPGVTGTFVIVKTNEGRMAKLLVQAAGQKISKEESLPILLIERYVTYKEGEERTIQTQGQNVRLFDKFRFNLDIGQVVPESVPADLRLVAEGDQVYVEPIGKAEMFVVAKHLPEANPKRPDKLTVGAAFEPRYFNGVYKLHDDGRRSGMLHLKVNEGGEVSGHYYSDKDGAKYDVEGKIGVPNHSIQFRVTLPRTIQYFQGWLFTGDGRAIAGSSKLQERETAFYAVRQE